MRLKNTIFKWTKNIKRQLKLKLALWNTALFVSFNFIGYHDSLQSV